MTSIKKLDDFPAHVANVNCLRIGRRSAGVFVTGGDDRKVNLWEVNQTKPLVSLSGHQSPVSAVTFDATEEFVAAGASGGTIKLWDVDHGRVSRSFSGHRSNVQVVEFHPIKGDFVASGSLDTNVKVWDLRRKACVQSFKGHAKGLSCLGFSPDGKWIATGSDDGEVKLWDLRTGQMLNSFKDHMARITGIEYHPKECMLATASADRTVRLWDLDNFNQIDVLGPETSAIRSIVFTPEGEGVIAATPDGLRLWGWEPACKLEHLEVAWPSIADMAVNGVEKRAIVCSFNHTTASVWSVNLSKLPLLQAEPEESKVIAPDTSRSFVKPKSFCESLLSTRRSGSAVSTMPSGKVMRVFSERENLNPVELDGDGGGLSPLEADVPSLHDQETASSVGKCQIDPPRPSSSMYGFRRSPQPSPRPSPFPSPQPTPRRRSLCQTSSYNEGMMLNKMDPFVNPIDEQTARSMQIGGDVTARTMMNPGSDYTCRSINPAGDFTARSMNPAMEYTARRRMHPEYGSEMGWEEASEYPCSQSVLGTFRQLDVDAFLPKRRSGSATALDTIGDDESVIAEMHAKRETMSEILSSRLSHLQMVRSFWSKGDLRGALRAMERCGDASVAEDFLATVNDKQGVFTLETIPDVIPCLRILLETDHEKYWSTVVDTLSTLICSFGHLIQGTTNQPAAPLGVDLSFEQRRDRCLAAKAGLQELVPQLMATKNIKSPLRRKVGEIRSQLEEL